MHWFRYHSKFLCLVWTCFQALHQSSSNCETAKITLPFQGIQTTPRFAGCALAQPPLETSPDSVPTHWTPSWQLLWTWRAVSKEMSVQWQEITMLQTTKQPSTVRMMMGQGVRPVVCSSSLCFPFRSLHFSFFFLSVFFASRHPTKVCVLEQSHNAGEISLWFLWTYKYFFFK